MKHLYRTTRETLVERITLATPKPAPRRKLPRTAPAQKPKPAAKPEFESVLFSVIGNDAHSLAQHVCENGDVLTIVRSSANAADVLRLVNLAF